MSAMKDLIEDFRTLVAELDAEGHKLAGRFRALFHKVTGEPVAETPKPPAETAGTNEGPST